MLIRQAAAVLSAAAVMFAGLVACDQQIPVPQFPDPTTPPTTSAPPSTTTTVAPTTTAAPTTTTTRPSAPTTTRPPLTSIPPVDPSPRPPAPPRVPVGPRLMFDGDFDGGDLAQYSNVQAAGVNGRPSGRCAGTDGRICVRDGGPGHTTAARVEVRVGDVAPGAGGNRAEVRAPDPAEVEPGDERWYQFSLLFPADYSNPSGDWFIVMQWHAGSGSPPLALEVSRAGVLQFANNRTGARTDIGPVRRGVWVDYTLHVRHSSGSGALAEAWVDGRHTGRVHRHPNMASSSSYLKLGVYRDSDDRRTAVVWHDGLRITAP